MTSSPWLPLLQRLTDGVPTWGVWKRPESALTGEGDVDSFAAEDDWGRVYEEFRAWAYEHELGPIVRCAHFSGLLILVACDGELPTRLLQLDVYGRHTFRGSTLLRASALLPLTELDRLGFRRLRAGAEGLIRLLRVTRRGGRPPSDQNMAQVLELLREDWEGAERLAAAVKFPARALRALEEGSWDRGAMLRFELRAAKRLFSDANELTSCVVRDLRSLRGCPLVSTLERGRRVEGERSDWLRYIAKSHVVEPGLPRSSRPEQ